MSNTRAVFKSLRGLIAVARSSSRLAVFAFCLLPLALLAAACRQDMHDQPKYTPLRPSKTFDDGRSARPLIEGTVARGYLKDDALLYTGKSAEGRTAQTSAASGPMSPPSQPAQGVASSQQSAQAQQAPTGQGFSDLFPFPVTKEVMDRGEQRYNIFCSVCHDRQGTGRGMVVRRGYRQPPSYHIDRLRQAPAGYFFDVITNGFGAMPDYSSQITPADRWAIVAYVRALQLSHQGTLADVPPDERDKLQSSSQQQGGQQQ